MENEKKSFPTRERGLKLLMTLGQKQRQRVVPYAGTWIETSPVIYILNELLGRSLRGNVD